MASLRIFLQPQLRLGVCKRFGDVLLFPLDSLRFFVGDSFTGCCRAENVDVEWENLVASDVVVVIVAVDHADSVLWGESFRARDKAMKRACVASLPHLHSATLMSNNQCTYP